jgi:predicted Rossmann fold nucleotide-binding protein DprA/Smf involved in DNA uptake
MRAFLLGKSMNEEIETATPAAVQTEQVQTVETTEVKPEATTEQTQETEQSTEQTEQPKRVPWFEKRIGEVTREKYEATRRAEQAEQQAQQLRDALARAQSGEQFEQPTTDVETLATKKATQMLAEQSFNQACNKVFQQGQSEFENFQDALNNLHLVGATANRAFLELTAASDAGHKLIHHLGTDLDKAAHIASLPPLQMARSRLMTQIFLMPSSRNCANPKSQHVPKE